MKFVKRSIFLICLLNTLSYGRNNPFGEINVNNYLINENGSSLLNIKPSNDDISKKKIITDKNTSTSIKSNKHEPIKIKKIDIPNANVVNQPTKIKKIKNNIEPPIVITDENAKFILGCCKKNSYKKKHLNRHKRTHKQKYYKYTTIYKNYFLTIKSNHTKLKIITKDCLISKKLLKNSIKLSLDFRKIQYFKSIKKRLNYKSIKSIKIGSHHCFYRIVVNFTKNHKIKILKKSYGYLIF